MIVLIHNSCEEADDLRAPPKHIWRKMAAKIEAGQGKPLKGRLAGLQSVRVGDYRVVYEPTGDYAIVLAVDHRKDVYNESLINDRRTR